MTPLQLVDLLNEVFQCFDGLVEKYDLEKIKTIGDCYMVASGVPAIGRKKFIYDLWGETVNLASRMESPSVWPKAAVFRSRAAPTT